MCHSIDGEKIYPVLILNLWHLFHLSLWRLLPNTMIDHHYKTWRFMYGCCISYVIFHTSFVSRWWKSLQDWFLHWLKRRHNRSTGIEVSFLGWFYLVKPFYWQCPKHVKSYDKFIMINIIQNSLWKTAMIFILHKTTWYVCTSSATWFRTRNIQWWFSVNIIFNETVTSKTSRVNLPL